MTAPSAPRCQYVRVVEGGEGGEVVGRRLRGSGPVLQSPLVPMDPPSPPLHGSSLPSSPLHPLCSFRALQPALHSTLRLKRRFADTYTRFHHIGHMIMFSLRHSNSSERTCGQSANSFDSSGGRSRQRQSVFHYRSERLRTVKYAEERTMTG